MSKGIVAGVIVKTRFVDKEIEKAKSIKENKKIQNFQSYIDYIGRDEAQRNKNFSKFSLYNDYMENPEKSNGLFTEHHNRLSEQQKQHLKTVFQQAYDNDSIMWQTVISFDNRYLAQLGIYDPRTKSLNEVRLQEATRNMMTEMLKRENMSSSAVWSASIHLNTDNIHVHVATVEPSPTRKKVIIDGAERPKGFFKAPTFRAMKSKVVNTLMDKDLSLLDNLVKRQMVAGKRNTPSFNDLELRKMFKEIYTKLPDNKRFWYYNMNQIKHLRPLIDKMSQKYIDTYHKDTFIQFKKELYKQCESFKLAYGENSRFKDYVQTKMDDLYTRMGNAILSEMRDYAKHELNFSKRVSKFDMNSYRLDNAMKKLQYRVNQSMKEKQENQMQYDDLIYSIEK